MKAWRMYDFGDIRLDDVPTPEVRPGWVLVKVRMVQPSYTEVQWSRGIPISGINKIEQLIKEKAPVQMFGHEFCGEVIKVGEGVKNVKEGDRVVYYRRAPCHQCRLCLTGHEEFCHKGPALGMDIPGCLAEYVLLPAEGVINIPNYISDSEAATMQPLSAAVAAAYAAEIDMGDTVVVLGQGVMGLYIMQFSQVCGAGKTIAVSGRDEALAISSQLGTDIVISASKMDPVEAVIEATEGMGSDVVFECGGGSHQLSDTERLAQAMSMVRDEGKIVQVAIVDPGTTLNVSSVHRRGIKYLGQIYCSEKLMRYAIDSVKSKRVKLAPLVTHVLEGLDKVPEAFEITGNKSKYKAINPAQVIVSR